MYVLHSILSLCIKWYTNTFPFARSTSCTKISKPNGNHLSGFEFSRVSSIIAFYCIQSNMECKYWTKKWKEKRRTFECWVEGSFNSLRPGWFGCSFDSIVAQWRCVRTAFVLRCHLRLPAHVSVTSLCVNSWIGITEIIDGRTTSMKYWPTLVRVMSQKYCSERRFKLIKSLVCVSRVPFVPRAMLVQFMPMRMKVIAARNGSNTLVYVVLSENFISYRE